MKNLQILVFFSLLLIVSQFVNGQNRLKLKLILDKNQFLEAEQIPVGIELTNISSVQLEAREPANKVGCNFKLFNEKGDEIEYTGPEISGVWPRYPLNPGEQLFNIENINDLFGDYISLATVYKVLPKGHYTLHAHYWSGGTYADWLSGKDTADAQITFEIIEPTGEEANAYKMFIDIMWEARGGGAIRSSEQLVEKLREFEKIYPTSVYTPMVLVILSSKYNYWLKQKDVALEIKRHLVEEYPFYVATVERGLFDYFIDEIKGRDGKKDYIKRLQKVTKSELANRQLKKVAKSKNIE